MSDVHEVTAQATITIHAPPERIWDALTDSAKLKSFFFGADIESDWTAGSPISWRGEYKGNPYEDKGRVVTAVAAKRLSFSHWSALSGSEDRSENYHLVTFDLIPGGDDTRVRLTQSNLAGGVKDTDREHRAEYEANWRTLLGGLKKIVES